MNRMQKRVVVLLAMSLATCVGVAVPRMSFSAGLQSFSGAPNPAVVGGSVVLTVVLDVPAEPGGEFVALFSSPSVLLILPPSVTFPNGQTEAQFKANVGSYLR